jgi:hypothetical protein
VELSPFHVVLVQKQQTYSKGRDGVGLTLKRPGRPESFGSPERPEETGTLTLACLLLDAMKKKTGEKRISVRERKQARFLLTKS